MKESLEALKRACRKLVYYMGTCPGDRYDWDGCARDDCKNQLAECWERYFLEKARE